MAMAPLCAALLLALCCVVAVGASQCQAPWGGDAPRCSKHLGLALLQTHQVGSKLEVAAAEAGQTAIQSGDTVLFQVARSGHRLTAQEDGTVHAKWDHDGTWQRFVIEKEVGSGDIQSGDAVFLTAWTGKLLTVGDYKSGELDRTALHAKWDHKGDWQKLTIEKKGEAGSIMAGDEIFLQAWTGARLDADTPDSAGTAQARWDHQGDWQKFIIEAVAAPESTAPPVATTAAPAPTSPSATQAAPDQECVEKQSLGQCEPCLKSEQCAAGKYCCPYMKKCVASSSDPCYYPIAQCVPMCYDSKDNSQCECSNSDFPDKWQLPTCASMATTPPGATTPSSATTPAAATTPAVATVPPAGTTPAPESGAEVVSAKAWEHFQLLNQLRAEGFTCPRGTAFAPNPVPLKFDCRLWRASRLHSEDMAEQSYFSHTSKDGRSPWDRAEEQGTDAHGENIAAGSSAAAGALEQFENSDGHCKNMMKQSFKVAAVGYAAGGPYGHYWTQMFSLFDADLSDMDTTCYPQELMLMQSDEEGNAADSYQKVLAEAWSRLPA
mmetsp:Transcript_9427/g.25597  ORF Transcript_9427/g.25597 Transcript_9427/m.25597 type:complete len:549 (-) Transcript_9427:187-1833(-)